MLTFSTDLHCSLVVQTNIHRVCQDMILNPKLFQFKELHIEVEVYLWLFLIVPQMLIQAIAEKDEV